MSDTYPECTNDDRSSIPEQVNQSEIVHLPIPPGGWQEPTPINSELLPVEKFDLSLLPYSLQASVADVARRMDNAATDYAAAAVMVALGSLLGKSVVIRPKRYDDWEVVPNIWGAIVGRPSAKKSPLMNEALGPLKCMEAKASDDHQSAMDRHAVLLKLNKLQQKEAERKAGKAVGKGNHADAEMLLVDAAQDESPAPARVRHIINDATVEKLGEILSDNPLGILLFRDELSGWLAGLNREDKAQDRSFFLEAWNGSGRYTYDRIGRGTLDIENIAVSVFGGIQPGKLQPLLSAQHAGTGDDGLLERIQLLVYPDQPPFEHVDMAPDMKARKQSDEVFEHVQKIRNSIIDSSAPKQLHFDDQAQTLFDDWYCELMAKAWAENNPHLESHLAKYPSLMASLALIIHIADSTPEAPIAYSAALKATAWCEYLESHARRIYGLAGDPTYGAKILVDRLARLPSPFQTKDFCRKGWSGLTKGADINRALTMLCDHGYLLSITEETPTRPKTLYYINPQIREDE